MSNDNGLISSLDLSATGAADSNFFLRKGVPLTVPTPLTIISPDTTEEATLSVDNGGSFVLTSNSVAFEPENNFTVIVGNATGGGAGLLVKPADQVSEAGGISLFNGANSATPTYYTTYNASLNQGGLTAGNLMTYGYSGAGGSIINQISNYTVTGSQITLGSSNTIGGTVLSINGFLGPSRVFDEQYNPPPTPPTPHVNTVTTLFSTGVSIPVNGFVSETFTLTPGVYQINCEYTAFNSLDYAIPANGTIATNLFLIGAPGFNPRADAIYFTTAMVPSLAGQPTGFPAQANFQSGFIIIPVIGANTFRINVDTNQQAYNFGGTVNNTGLNFTIIKFSS